MNEIFAVWQQYQLWIVIYSAIFSFSLIALLESNWPAFRAHSPTGKRWAINFGFWSMAWLVGLLLPVSMLVAANGAQESGWGVFNQFSLPLVVQIIAGFLAVDALHYSLHRALHEWGPLWRIHAVHHSDQDYDLTVGFRFHPLEAVLMFATRVLLVFAL
ncbi:MAG: sterol desaturase family protein, partial [bacterium]